MCQSFRLVKCDNSVPTFINYPGHGSVTPKTTGGKILTMLYALFGIPLMLMCLSSLSGFLVETLQCAQSRLCRKKINYSIADNDIAINARNDTLHNLDVRLESEDVSTENRTICLCIFYGDKKIEYPFRPTAIFVNTMAYTKMS